jgi:hypothetical protein
MKKDLDYIAKLERAIKQKYGSDAIQNPASYWDEEKEKEYLQQLKEYSVKRDSIDDKIAKVDAGGFLVNKKLLSKDNKINCPVCKKRTKTVRDDIYMNKFECCEQCYIVHVEDREDRWLQGWRPNNVTEEL